MMKRNSAGGRKSSSHFKFSMSLLTHALSGLVCFYLGLLLGMGGNSNSNGSSCATGGLKCPACSVCPVCPRSSSSQQQQVFPSPSTSNNKTFPSTISNMFVDYATVPRDDFNGLLELGVPLDDTKVGSEDVLVLYTSQQSLPRGGARQVSMSPEQALQHCGTVKTIYMEPYKRDSCLAIVPQWESYYVHKWMRLPKGDAVAPNNPKLPLRYVSRTHTDKGTQTKTPDYNIHTKPSYGALVEYLQNLNSLLQDLTPLLKQLVQASTNPPGSNSIIVQVCNYGQVELFHNFLCSAKARDLDFSRIFMFATDQKTYDLCHRLGIPAYYNEAIFGEMPEVAAHGYGDKIFSKMMMAKVYCVHLVLSLGYNVLFQDVDVVWYKNPLPYLESPEWSEWDMLFQDDGARSNRYAPYSPNTGFYYVRYSQKTLYFFGMLLRSGDSIARLSSHQAALTALLNEHVSWKGLRVKVFKKGDSNPFPGGVEYHQKKDMMKALLKGERAVKPYIFHMSWTKNKDNKKLFFQQMGEWYLSSQQKDCSATGDWDCCLAEPEVTCHYRDKPSIIPCRDVPPIDAGKPSFW